VAAPKPLKTGPAYEIVKLAWEHGGKSPRTDRAANDACHKALNAAVEGGFRWTADDAIAIDKAFQWTRGQYRFGIGEGTYKLAVDAGNESACKSMERLFGREPWMWPFCSPDGMSPGRIAQHSSVCLDNLRWEVTTMEADRLILCHYDDTKPGRRAPKRRLTLNREQVAALVAATSPTPEPEIPALTRRYTPVYPDSARPTNWFKCTCEDDGDPCWFCESTRRHDLETRATRTRAAKSGGRWARARGMTLATAGATDEAVEQGAA
jgi:hypothetical protein